MCFLGRSGITSGVLGLTRLISTRSFSLPGLMRSPLKNLRRLRFPPGPFVELCQPHVHLGIVERYLHCTLTPPEAGLDVALFGRNQQSAVRQNLGIAASLFDELTQQARGFGVATVTMEPHRFSSDESLIAPVHSFPGPVDGHARSGMHVL